MKKILPLFVITLVSVSMPAFNAAASIQKTQVDFDRGTGNVEFHATGHPSALRVVGKGSAAHGSFVIAKDQISGTASFDLTTLDTGIALRTTHMKEKYLETDKYKQAVFKLKKLTLPRTPEGDHYTFDNIPFSGTLSLHGVERPISGVAKIERNGNTVATTAQFGLKISDFGITTPSFAGITIADDVQVSLSETAPLVTSVASAAR